MSYKSIYDDMFSWHGYSAFDEARHQPIIETFSSLEKKDRVIDLGTGRAHLPQHIKQFYPETKLTLVDLNKYYDLDMFGQEEFIECDFTKASSLAKLTGSWDVALCMDVLEHLPRNKQRAFVETVSKIAPVALFTVAGTVEVNGGYILHKTVAGAAYYKKLFGEFFKIKHFSKDDRPVFNFTLESKR